jgi:hypothetical protein
MRRLLLIRKSGLDPVPVKGTTRHECYRALYEIQELLETRRYFGRHLPQTHADRIRAMTDEELAHLLHSAEEHLFTGNLWNYEKWTEWLKQEASE